MDVMCIFICGFLILTTVDRVKTDCITDNNREVWNIKEETRIGHEDQIIWRTDYDSSWRVIKPNNSFVDVYFINVTESNEIWLNLIVNVTGSTDLDNAEDCSGVKKDSFFLQCGNIPSLNFTVRITPENEHTPEIFTDINMTKELNEDYMVSRSVIEYGKRVKDEDCPKQRLEYSVVKQGDATIDENPKQKTATSSLTMTVIDLDDEPPKFVDMLQGCNKKCKTCYTKSFIGNTSYESKGEITVNPPLIAEDIYSVNASVILYYIRKVTPDEYSSLFMININNGTISVSESLQNATNNTIKEDFIVLLHIQAHDVTKLRYTTNVTVDVKIKVKNDETSGKNDDDSTGSNIIMIILPVLAAVIIVVTIVLLWWRRQLCFAKNKHNNIKGTNFSAPDAHFDNTYHNVDEAKATVKETSYDILFAQYADVNRAKLSADITEEIDQEESSENVEDAEYDICHFNDDDEENQTP
ncbi:uncharacterized protein LOC143054160 isoform X6 [Mytilus galloprovincialis]|uniref:uncharacterized protein LOC143054160 isoform X6 n=1 Tax=Mytilus galloprovincialis TaxID=29158 RepID=UPI003F7C4804